MENNNERIVDLSRTIYEIKKHWYYYAICFVLFVGFGAFYMYKKNPVYMFRANMLIEQESGSGANSAAAAMLKSFSMGGFGGGSVDDELLLMQSHSIVKQVVTELKLNRLYIDRVGVKNLPLYNDSPIEIKIPDAVLDTIVGVTFHVYLKENGKADIVAKKGFFETVFESADQQLPATATPSTGGVFVVDKTDKYVPGEERHIIVNVSDNDGATEDYMKNIFIDYASTKSNGIRMELEDNHKQRGLDVLNKMFEVFNRRRIDENNRKAESELKFIDERLASLTGQLSQSEEKLQRFKTDNGIIDLTTEAGVLFEQNSQNNRTVIEQQTQLAVLDMILDFLADTNNSYSLIPVNSGLDNESAASVISDYNALILQRMKLDSSAKGDNRALTALNAQIDAMRTGVVSTIRRARDNAKVALAEFTKEGGKYATRLRSLSANEREFFNLTRDKEIKNNLYIFLIEQRENSLLQIGSSSPVGRVVDAAYREVEPIKPKASIVLGLALIMALLIPTMLCVYRTVCAKTIVMKYDVNRFTDIPVVAEMGKCEDQIVDFCSPSAIADDLRSLRNSIVKTGARSVMITSLFEGEGKAFVGVNVARLFALSAKRVVVVDCTRTGNVSKLLGVDGSHKGITDIALRGCSADDVVCDSSMPQISVITPGSVASEMPEALVAEGFASLIKSLKDTYDVVLVVTSSVNDNASVPVAAANVDQTVLVLRSGMRKKPYVRLFRKISNHLNPDNTFFAVNAFKG